MSLAIDEVGQTAVTGSAGLTSDPVPHRSSVGEGGDQTATSKEEPTAGAAPHRQVADQPPAGSAAPSLSDDGDLGARHDAAFIILEAALDAGTVTVSDVLRVAAPILLGIADAKMPTERFEFWDMPTEVLEAVTRKLGLGKPVPA